MVKTTNIVSKSWLMSIQIIVLSYL